MFEQFVIMYGSRTNTKKTHVYKRLDYDLFNYLKHVIVDIIFLGGPRYSF
jgi:hypothetical protein